MMGLSRHTNESDFEWKIRLVVSKINKVIDLDWSEIRDLLDLDCSPDHLRKTAYGIHEYHQYIQESSEKSSNTELDDKILEFHKMKTQFQDQKREYMKLVKDQARFDHIKSEIVKAVRDLEKVKPVIPWVKLNSNTSNIESALIISDWHKGLFTRNYWNNFDNKEFDRRVNRLVTKTIEYNRLHNVSKLHVFSIGDLVNGLIHVTTRINATEDVIQQTMSVAETLCEVLCRLAENTPIKYYHVRGNHDRVTPNKSDELAQESFADVIVWYLKARLSHIKNIEFIDNVYDDEIAYAEICGQKVFAVHGHKDKPSQVVKDLSGMTKIVPDYVFMGHYHHHEENEIHGTEVIINSSLSGVDSYAKDVRKTGKPAQKLIIFDPHETRLATYNIRLDIM